ncbi:XrtA/PEP-CTERM system TPR-repeat protein PrsT [Alicycliphilus denitrificans]|uniref:XrtA/PEP-CTERM system TPR-repeat protein PrsT n=1 Tax=Alicycliphilus denitrificans TaxID=179636 RepID=UPI00384EAB63
MLASILTLLLSGCSEDSLKAGQESMQKQDYAAAVIHFKNAVQDQPNSVQARLALADALERVFDPIGAEQHLRKAIDRGGNPDELVPRIVVLMLERGELEAIIREFKQRRLDSPAADSILRALVSIAYASQKQLALAEAQIKDARSDTTAMRLAKAQLFMMNGKPDKALAELKDLPESDAASWWSLRAIARIYTALGDQASALKAIQRAHAAAPWHHGVIGEYGEALITSGKPEEAAPLLQKLRAQAPNYFWTHYLNAIVLSREGRTEESHAAALKVLAVSPDHLPAVLLAATAELQKGDLQMADSRLGKILQQHPDSLPALQLQAATQLRLGRVKEASNSIRHGLSMRPGDLRLLSLRADVELREGDLQKAAATLDALVAASPNDAHNLLRLSEIRLRLGQKNVATALLDKAMEAGQDNPAMRDQILAQALKRGDIARVRHLANHALQTRPQDPQSHLSQAAALAAQKDMAGAWRATLAALDLKPGFDAALRALAGMAREPQQHEELLARYARAIESRPQSPHTYLTYAALLAAAPKPPRDKVVQVLEQGLANLPAATPLRAALIEEQLRAGNPDAAMTTAQSGAANSNAPAEAVALLASTYDRLGKTELAAESYRNLVANHPQRADWRLKLAEMELAAGRKNDASTLLRGLIADRPFDSTAYIALANMTAADNLPEALTIARDLGERTPHKQAAMLLEGDVLARAGKNEEALKQFAAASKAGAEPAASLRAIAVLDKTAQRPAADEALSAALRKHPNHAEVLAYAAQRALGQGQPEKAVEWLGKVVAQNPRNPIALNELAWAQIQARHPQALENARKAAQLLPDDPTVLDTLGLALAQAGQHQSAITTLRTAVQLAPTKPSARLHLTEQLLAAGDRQEARAMLAQLNAGKLNAAQQAEHARLGQLLSK